MKAFLLRVALFLLVLLVPLLSGEAYIRIQPNPARAKHEYLKAHSREVEVLVLGSSHTYYGVSPELLGAAAYSAAQVSQTYRYDAYMLTRYPFPRLRTVVLPLSDFSLYEELEESSEWFFASRYRIYMDCPIHSPLSVYAWEFTAFPSYCQKLGRLWSDPRMSWSEWGQGLEYALANRPPDWDNGEARALQLRYEGAPLLAKPYLWQMAGWCRTHGVRMLLVTTPLRPSYLQNRSSAQVAEVRRCLKQLLRDFPETVAYYDFSADARFGEADFYDADHLSLEGSHKFTKLLRSCCPPPACDE